MKRKLAGNYIPIIMVNSPSTFRPGKQDYVIWADATGYKSAGGKRLQAEPVKVHVDADERVDTGLHLR